MKNGCDQTHRGHRLCIQGALIFLCAGDKDLYEYASPLLDVMGKARFFLGQVRTPSVGEQAVGAGLEEGHSMIC